MTDLTPEQLDLARRLGLDPHERPRRVELTTSASLRTPLTIELHADSGHTDSISLSESEARDLLQKLSERFPN